MNLCLGAGEDQQKGKGWINHDLLPLPGIDVVHNLIFTPYPFEDNQFDHIRCTDVIEHLPNYDDKWQPMIIRFIEEVHRILKPGGDIFIQTPGYRAEFAWQDPTHVKVFHVKSMDLFDPTTEYGKTTGFYSKCKFEVFAKELKNHNIQYNMVKI